MTLRDLCISFMYVLFTSTSFNCDPLLLDRYKISLYSDSQKLCTVLWLRPAYCLYEEWMRKALDLSLAERKTSTIQVQVQIPGDNDTYIVPQSFNIPNCNPIFQDYGATDQFVYQVGPSINTSNRSRVQGILPGNNYMVRYVLHNAGKIEVAYTNWSEPFQTRDMVPSAREVATYLQGRSGGMIVITVILSIAMFILLVGLGVTFLTSAR